MLNGSENMIELPFTIDQPAIGATAMLFIGAFFISILVLYRKGPGRTRRAVDGITSIFWAGIKAESRPRVFARCMILLACISMLASVFAFSVALGILKNGRPPSADDAMRAFFEEHHVDDATRKRVEEKIKRYAETKAENSNKEKN